MLLNLSDAFSDTWSEEQMTAAKEQFSEVGDLAFPNIDPQATTADVKKIARSYARQIRATKEIKAVHLMGEMTFVNVVANSLQRGGMPVFCSTTERIVLEEQDGKKTAQFRFIQFRRYV